MQPNHRSAPGVRGGKPYGGTRYTSGSAPTSFRYTGQRSDAYINLYQMGAWYHLVWLEARTGRPWQRCVRAGNVRYIEMVASGKVCRIPRATHAALPLHKRRKCGKLGPI